MKLGMGVPCGAFVLALLMSSTAWAQGMDFGEEEAVEPVEGDQGMDFGGEDPGETAEVEEAPAEVEEGGDDDFLADIGGTEDGPVEAPQMEGPGLELEDPEVWAVQRAYALRYRRFELLPRFGFSMNDQFVSHFAFGGELNWYVTDVLAVGIEGQWYYWNPESNVNYYTSRSFRVSVPINEYWMGWYLNFHYVPLYGKFAVFNRWILHWDTFVVGGLGVTMTRPVAAVDAEYRDFSEIDDWNVNVTFNIGIGGRTFLTRWLAIFAELRLYGFPQALEETNTVSGIDCATASGCPNWDQQRANPETWLDEDGEFAINVMAQVGLSIFLPPTFRYRLPL